jgi:NADPH2:quinone reductase
MMGVSMRAVVVHDYGGPEVLRLVDVERPEPGSGHVRMRIEAAGVNYLDVYQRTGAEPAPLPRTLGVEAVGSIDAVGPDVTDPTCLIGRRVLSASLPGAYAQYAVVPWDRVVPMPRDLEPLVALAAMLQGMTAHYLTHDTYPVRRGDTVLVYAAAGGTGSQIVQMSRRRGARVLAVVSTVDKAARARELGANEVIVASQDEIAGSVRTMTGGKGVDVVYDSVGLSTFQESVGSLRRRGLLVLFGQSSGAVEPIDPLLLKANGSLYLTRPTLADYIATREELIARSGAVFDAVRSGDLQPRIEQTLPLAMAAEAHRRLQSREAQGKFILIP